MASTLENRVNIQKYLRLKLGAQTNSLVKEGIWEVFHFISEKSVTPVQDLGSLPSDETVVHEDKSGKFWIC